LVFVILNCKTDWLVKGRLVKITFWNNWRIETHIYILKNVRTNLRIINEKRKTWATRLKSELFPWWSYAQFEKSLWLCLLIQSVWFPLLWG
jgi:hypothetical protein